MTPDQPGTVPSQPKFLFLSINEVCNLRCRHCEYWTVDKPSLSYTSLSRQLEIIAEFAEISPGGTVVICGGEPMLDVATYFEVCIKCRQLGLRSLSVTNGTLITNTSDATRVLHVGPDEISISLDSPDPGTHDAFRGKTGSFNQATTAISLLVEARLHTPIPRKINVMGLLTASNARRLPDFYMLALDVLHADKLKLNALQPSFLNTSHPRHRPGGDKFFETESQVDVEKLLDNLEYCDRRWNLNLNPRWKAQVVAYFQVLRSAPDLSRGWGAGLVTDDVICDSALRNIMVDVRGRASLCFSNQFPSVLLEKPGDMTKLWREAPWRVQMATCRALCGISHSVRREHATLPKSTP